MSAGEKWKFYLPILLTIFLTVVPGVALIKSDLGILKHELGTIRHELPLLERKDVADLQHQKLRLEIKVLEQKIEQLRVEFREFCRTVSSHVATPHVEPK